MVSVFKAFLLAVFMMAASPGALAEDVVMSEHTLGKDNAPVKVDEYSSLTCTHCAHFYLHILPELEKRYVDTGKVRFVMHDFPLNAMSLKAAAVAQCMPKDIYFPFIKTLFEALEAGKFGGSNSEAVLYQYAALGGLPADKASACANDVGLQNTLIAGRTKASEKYKIEATPTFIIDDGAEIISGALDTETFAAAFDRQLAAKKN